MSALPMDDEQRELSRSLLALCISNLRDRIKRDRDELDDMVSVLRNDLANAKWSDGTLVVDFLPGRYVSVRSRRIGKGLTWKRVRTEPYLRVREVKK
jgi:hypothetical protein